MRLSDINEAMIRQEAGSPEVFQRGMDYLRRGAVDKAILRGNMLTAEVEGSEYDPYRIVIELGKSTLQSADCTCPYGEEWDGWCKHIVATLLLAITSPRKIEEAMPLSELLDPIERDDLQNILLRLAERDPYLADKIALEVEALETPVTIIDTKSERRIFPVVDADAIRRQIRGAIRRLDHMRSSEAYWHVGEVVEDILDGPIQTAEVRLDKGDARGSLATLEAVIDAYLPDWTDLDGSDGETPEPFYAAGKIMAEALFIHGRSDVERTASLGQKVNPLAERNRRLRSRRCVFRRHRC